MPYLYFISQVLGMIVVPLDDFECKNVEQSKLLQTLINEN